MWRICFPALLVACQTPRDTFSEEVSGLALPTASDARDDGLVAQAHGGLAVSSSPPAAECAARYEPNACTAFDVSSQWVDYEGATECTGSAQPGAVVLAEYLAATFPGHGGYGIYNCRTIADSTSYSLHAEGRAIDFMIPMDSSQAYGADNSLGDPVADFLLEHAEEIGIQSFTWDRTIFYGDEAAPKHHCVSIADGHWNHLHIELSWDAAHMLTPWFQPSEEAEQSETNSSASLPILQALGDPLRVQMQTPERIFDTRQDSASTGLVRADGTTAGPLQAGGANTFSDWGATATPSDAEAVWLNLVGLADLETSFVTVWPSGETRPDTSNLNLSCRQNIRANAVPVGMGDGGSVSFYAYSEVDAIADLTAAFTPDGSGVLPIEQTRLLDTRRTTSLAHEEVRRVSVDCASLGVDCDGSSPEGLVGTLTVLASDEGGFVTAWPCDQPRPDTSSINVQAHATVANALLIPVSADGELCLYSYSSDGVDLLVDVSGLVLPDGPLDWQSVVPERILDTRSSASTSVGRLAAGQTVEVEVHGLPGIPEQTEAVAVNITAVDADGWGFVEAFPCDAGGPTDTSVLNFDRADATAATAIIPIGPETGRLCVYSYTRTHLLVDLLGAWVRTPEPEDPEDPEEPDDPEPEDEDTDAASDSEDERSEDTGMDRDTGGASIETPEPPAASSSCSQNPIPAGRGGVALLLGLVGVVCRLRRQQGCP